MLELSLVKQLSKRRESTHPRTGSHYTKKIHFIPVPLGRKKGSFFVYIRNNPKRKRIPNTDLVQGSRSPSTLGSLRP